jgi:hypothetical protein
VLLLALLVSVLAVFNVSYLPEWKADAEQEHMDEVYEDMSHLKARGDMLALASSLDEDTVISLSVPVRMGGGFIPFVGTEKSSGTVFANGGFCNLNVTAVNATGGNISAFSFRSLGTIIYVSHNNYYVDQVFSYENGALIVSQKNRSIMKLYPSVFFKNTGGDNYSLYVNSLSLEGNPIAFSGDNIQDIRLSSNNSTWLFRNNETLTDVTISVNSSYPASWASYFNTSAQASGLTYSTEYTLEQGEDYASISIFPAGSLELYLKYNTIDVAVGIF